MNTTIPNVTLTAKANVYFDGKCISHSFTQADGSKQSVGVVLPSELTFTTGAPEVMLCVGGSCEYRLAGNEQWHTSTVGQKFSVRGNSSFDIRVTDAYHYICQYD